MVLVIISFRFANLFSKISFKFLFFCDHFCCSSSNSFSVELRNSSCF